MNQIGLDTSTFCQVGIVVDDIERAIWACSRLVGAAEPDIIVTDAYEHARTHYRGQPTAARAKLAFFRMGAVALELIEPIGGPSTWREFLEENGPGIHHIAFTVKGTDQVIGALRGRGATLVQQGEYTGGRYSYLEADPDLGFVLELLEDLDASDQD